LRLTDLLTPDRIRVPLQSSDKEGVLRELVRVLLPEDGGQEEEVLAAIMERERQFPTGIGHGVAVPHGRTPAMAALAIVAGTSPNPVNYETIDGQPVRLFFLLAGPEALAGAHVKALSRISRLVRHEGVRARLLAARTPQEFYRAMLEAEGV
jgi:mannitol/fructose-specific phosphotransferase system IIA component (Ntr-type)